MRLEWRDSARQDLRDILDFISDRNVDAAHRLVDRLEFAAERLTFHPYMGRPGRVAGTREFVAHPNYILIYRVMEQTIEVVQVLHARMQYPPD